MTVYIMDAEALRTVPTEKLRRLIPLRYEKAQHFRRPQDQRMCLAAGLLIRQVLLADENNIQYSAYGKPYLPDIPPFNLTHSGGFAALVTADAAVGVDIEQLQKKTFR